MPFADADLPRAFGPYTLKQKLARGGMAELYLAEMRGFGGFAKPVVIKMIHQAHGDEPKFRAMFTDEAKILAGLAHGNIVPIFDFGEVEGRLYLAMEFIDGVDAATLLETCCRSGIPLSLDVALGIGVGAAAGLAHAHGARGPDGRPLRIVHRDISPPNILLSRGGEVKLCDFGIALSATRERDTDLKVVKGKLRYLSPEQAAGEDVDARSDIFSLGVVLYELVAGHHPVPSAAEVAVLQKLGSGEGYPSLRDVAPWVPEPVGALVDRALAFDPERRVTTAEELRLELSRVAGREAPGFGPERLAALVIAVQEANERESGRDDESSMRARLASFAAMTREATERRAVRRRKTIGKALGVGALAIALAAVAAGPALFSAAPAIREPGQAARAVPIAPAPAAPAPAAPTALPPAAEGTDTARAAPERRAAAPPAKRGFGTVDVNASPWAEVEIDGVAYTTTPIIGIRLPAGRHTATFTNDEIGAAKKRVFSVRPGETVRLVVEME